MAWSPCASAEAWAPPASSSASRHAGSTRSRRLDPYLSWSWLCGRIRSHLMARGRSRRPRGHASFHCECAFHANEGRPHPHDARVGSTAPSDGFLYGTLRDRRCDWCGDSRDAAHRGVRADSFFHRSLAREHSRGPCWNNSPRTSAHTSLAARAHASPVHLFGLVVHSIAFAFGRGSFRLMYNAPMKRLFLILALLFSASLLAQAPAPVPLAHGDVPGEPHHHLKIENEYVRVYYVEVPPHENTQLHQHDHDYLFVTLGDSDVINAIRDKPEVHLVLRDGETHFTRGGFAHVARNLSDAPFRNVTIELLKPQGQPRNVCAEVLPGVEKQVCSRSVIEKRNGMSHVPQFQTDEMEASLTRCDPDAEHVGFTAYSGTLFVLLSGSGIQTMVKGSPEETLEVGDVRWLLAGSNTTFSNPSHKAWSYLTMEFKGS